MIDMFQAKAAREIFDRIDGKADGICTLRNAELAVLRANQQQAGAAIATAFLQAAGRDAARCDRFIQQACKLEPEEIRHRALIAHDKLREKKPPSLSQWAALLIVGRAEHDVIEEEIARREAGQRGAH